MIKQFDKSNIQSLRDELSQAVAAVEAKHGIKIAFNGIKYSEESFECKMSVAVADGDNSNPKYKHDFSRCRTILGDYGILQTDLGKKMKINQEDGIVVGCTPRGTHILVQVAEATYKVPVEQAAKRIIRG